MINEKIGEEFVTPKTSTDGTHVKMTSPGVSQKSFGEDLRSFGEGLFGVRGLLLVYASVFMLLMLCVGEYG